MPDNGADFVSELVRAATQTARMTNDERAWLLERAAATLRDYLLQIGHSEAPANQDRAENEARDWMDMARLIDLFSADEVSAMLLDAAEIIETARVLLEDKPKTGRDE